MLRFGSIFLAYVYSLMIKIVELIHNHRSKSILAEKRGSNFSDDEAVSQNSSAVLFGDEERNDFDSVSSTEGSVSFHNGRVSVSSSKCEIMSGKNVSGFLEEAMAVNFVVQEMFVGCDGTMGFEQNLGENIEDSVQESAFYFKLLSSSVYADEETQKNFPEIMKIGAECMDADDDHKEENPEFVEDDQKEKNPEFEEDDQKEENPEFLKENQENQELDEDDQKEENPEILRDNQENQELEEDDQKEENPEFLRDNQEFEERDHKEEYPELMKEEDFAYEVELIPNSNKDDNEPFIISQEIEKKNDSENWMSSFLEEAIDIQTFKNSCEEEEEEEEEEEDEDEEEFIELELQSSHDVERKSQEHEQKKWASDSDEDEDEEEGDDVLSQHQHLVEQMKMELKNCRTRGLPTISEESETPKIIEDLRPLRIDSKVGYKDVMEGIQSFYKSYVEKMKKLDILNYQTSHAISFLHLKECEAFTSFKKRANPLVPKILAGKVRRVYADPMHKSIEEMNRDLEVVYVGQMCLSWEILWWLDARTRELLDCEEVEGSHSYNHAFEEFQQFQVLVQRFMEDELFKGRRHENYVKSRSIIRSLLQVPIIKDDCLKKNKEKREETDVITLEMLLDIVFETMAIFQEFISSDKKATNPGLITKVDVQESGSSELVLDVISSLEKKGRRMKEQMRSENCCILKKMKKKKQKHNQERRLMDREILAAQVDLRLIWRVLNMSRLSEDHLIWCKNKLNNINFVGRKVRREACFLLFPC